MFQFPHLPLPSLCVQLGVPEHNLRWVAPFGNPRLSLLAANRGLSQLRHALLRLLTPRHPPCALSNFAYFGFFGKIEVFFILFGS
jgi:hypothetical protein